MSVLVGILLGLSRLAADSEVTAMRASGIGVLSFVRIVSIFAVFAWALGLANSLVVAAPRRASSPALRSRQQDNPGHRRSPAPRLL